MSSCKDCPANMYNAWLEAEDKNEWINVGLSTITTMSGRTSFMENLLKEWECVRCSNYPSLEEQQDMQYWDSINGTTNWLDTITKVKQDYPKPSWPL